MDETFQAILDSLPPKPTRSKLEPFTELIQELRKRGRSYREIAGILGDRCGVRVGTHTLYNFVRVRTATAKSSKKAEKPTPVAESGAPNTAAASNTRNSDVWQRIQELKQRPAPARAPGAEKVFHYNENEPLVRTPAKKADV